MDEYKLSASLSGHEDDVRAVISPTAKVIISASRDGTVRIWKLLSEEPPVYDAIISSNSSSFVNSLAYLSPNQPFPEGLVISGGKDTVIEVRQPTKGPEDNAEALLLGHGNNICALDVSLDGKYIVSGSWDSEARVWPVGKWEAEVVLKDHQGSVWGVLAFDSETVITGCADKLIRVWTTGGKLLRTIRGTEDCVRALCRIPKGHQSGADFASAGNDGKIRFWSLSGHQLGQFHAHDSYIYSLATSPSGEMFSSGEDRSVRVWKGTECQQTITHPAISVWDVAVCPENGDIVTGSSDRIVRVFTRDSARAADVETLKQFEDSVKQSSIPQQSLPDVNKEELPGPEFLTSKLGTKEGQVQMIREPNGSVTAHTWSAGSGQWTNVGTVVDAVGSSGKKVDYLGKEYDYVFDVDIEDGKPALKLPYNLSQNPYEAATKFIHDNELPITYLDQVANFITTNTQGATIGHSQESSSAPDAWGSDNRYRPGDDAAARSTGAPPRILPQKEYLNILTARVAAMQKKIGELNQALIQEGQKDVSLNPAELSTLGGVCSKLDVEHAATKSNATTDGLSLAVKLTTTWPYKDRLPGLDLLRLLAVAPETAKYSHNGGSIVDILISASSDSTPVSENHVMMAIRAFVNLFSSEEGRALAATQFDQIQNLITDHLLKTNNRNLLVAVSTIYINYAVYFAAVPDPTSFEHVTAIFDTLSTILATQADSEVIYRALVATGTLLALDEDTKNAAKEVYDIKGAVDKALHKASDPRVKSVCKEIGELLR